ncbi:glutamate synthase (NADPH) small subunit [Candidatus Magnetomorum sp. HK-1]|nr:glutamate synthase (NADPH) small subunit [Candidatus Magnetomorum sp. HK-1]
MNLSVQSQGESLKPVSLSISQSRITTQVNNTGTWRFVRPKYQEKTAPCSIACPLGVDIALVEMMAARKDLKKAHDTLLMENPFPAICGRVCFHPCENACNRKHLDKPVAVHHIERFIGDWGLKNNLRPEHLYPEQNNSKIAIIGAGPAGLAVAYFGHRLGYSCDIFDKSDGPGGLLDYGIPSYRLPKDILKHELRRLENDGINMVFNQSIFPEKLDALKQNYDAIFLCCGDAKSIQLKIPGENNTIDGLNLLHQIHKKTHPALKGDIAVIGGGNTAVDVARSLVRLGTRPIIVYRRTQNEMPAHPHEINAALAEGVILKECLSPMFIESDTNKQNLSLQVMKAHGQTRDGRQAFIPDGDRKETLTVDHVITAIGAEPELMWHLQPDQWDMKISHCRMQMNEIPYFWCGDLATSEKTVTHALASGKQAILALDILRNHSQGDIPKILKECQVGDGESISFEMYIQGKRLKRSSEKVSNDFINAAYFFPISEISPKNIPIDDCRKSFDEVIQTFEDSQAIKAAERCFNCGICNDCDTCRIFCPEMAIQWENGDRHILMDYCKGCGICIVECPRNAMTLEVEP